MFMRILFRFKFKMHFAFQRVQSPWHLAHSLHWLSALPEVDYLFLIVNLILKHLQFSSARPFSPSSSLRLSMQSTLNDVSI